ncbi:NfeD family protein [Prosthecobacter dejongeii]|uniref:Membrane-bound serine protease (ClpP class) n=1 Tax=Prosthecobacter dejongeii TaxID=48465 RepID=A0A7W7YL11_9BACT|nr:NfeD family protein [Prosthecobacter dejongeii]MBB5038155.1 membrane-bound serine protease (ClpP class) [Prosthecobacter dejongeii]
MITTVAIIVILGVLLMILETFIPGMIAGILGVLCVLTGVLLVMMAEEFSHWPAWGRGAVACFIIVGSAILQLIWLRFFAVQFWSRTFTLQAEIPSAENPQTLACGTEGVALTELRPLGRADFSGSRREVRSEDGFIPAGSRLCVTGAEPGNLLVRAISLHS